MTRSDQGSLMSESPYGESLRALTRFFVSDGTFCETLQRVSELTMDAVGPADFVGITMLVEGRERTAAFTDPTSHRVDQAQYDTNEGPCLDAFRESRTFQIDSTSEPGPWSAFRAAAAAEGIGSSLSLPLLVKGEAVGAMNLYSKEKHAFSESECRLASQFATQAAIVLSNAQAYWDSRALSENLNDALASRAVIEQAKGMLMAAQRCSAEESFELLVKASQRENVKVRDIASRMVAAATAGDSERDPLAAASVED